MFVLEPPALPAGTWVHFDIETNPLARSGNEIVYLWGLLAPPYNRNGFDGIWVDNEAGDRQGWLVFLSCIKALRDRYPDMVLAHYGNFEVTKIRMYAERYAMQEHPTVAWLLGEHSPLFDMCRRVEQSLILPLPGRGLKAVCKSPKLVNYQWQDEGSGSQWSVAQYVRFLETADAAERQLLKDSILQYNFDDVMATRALELWMRSL